MALIVLLSSLLLGFLVMYAMQMAKIARKAQAIAEQATEAKSNFLSNMSHEIRTPLTAIIGYTETLLIDKLSEVEAQEALRTIDRNSKHLLRLINDILDLSKIEAGKLEIEKIEVSLVDLLSDLSNFISPLAQAKKLSFGFEYAYPIPRYIVTDPLRLKQILINLIGNAIKFTQTGGVKVNVIYLQNEQHLSFAVVDTGIGLTNEQQSRLFQAFTQADASTTRKFGGTGLGLLISSQLADRLGGRISIESSPQRGSVFTLTIDTELIESSNLIEHMPQSPPIEQNLVSENQTALAGHVLLAEDGSDNQKYLTFLLTKIGLTVTLVDNGQKAVEQIQREPFDLILMDMQMPIMDGYTAMKRLRADGCTVPIIALTANAMHGDIERCRTAGCSDFLGKPFSREDFFAKLRSFLGHKSVQLIYHIPDTTVSTPAHAASEDQAFIDLIRKFNKNLENRYFNLDAAFQSGDFAQLESLAHQLSGCGGYYGHSMISEISRKLEKAAARRDVDCASILAEIRSYVNGVQLAEAGSTTHSAPQSEEVISLEPSS